LDFQERAARKGYPSVNI